MPDSRKTYTPQREGAPPPAFVLPPDITTAFYDYESKVAGHCFVDPRGVEVWFFDFNFRKLIQLQFKPDASGHRRPVMAKKLVEDIRAGTFKEHQFEWDNWRLGTLLSTPEVIEHPDSIHRNIRPAIAGDTVYVKRYAKAGEPYKLVFTLEDERLGKRTPTTAFWVPTHRLRKFVAYPALWEKGRAAVASGSPRP